MKKDKTNHNKMVTYSFPANLELNAQNQHELKFEMNLDYNTLTIHHQSEIRIICLTEMKVDRVIDNIPEQIDSVGIYSEGIYCISSNRREHHLTFIERDGVSELYSIPLDSRVLSHLAIEQNDSSLLVTISADKVLRVYDAYSGETVTEKNIHWINRIELDTVTMHIHKNSGWICWVINGTSLIYINLIDWHSTYPIADEVYNVINVAEMSSTDWCSAIIWSDYREDLNTKTLTLIKMPPENDQNTYRIEHHKIPYSENLEILDFVSAANSLLLLVKNKDKVNLIKFEEEEKGGYNFSKLGSIDQLKHQYIFARIDAATYLYDRLTGEQSVLVHFVFQRCLEIGTHEFISKGVFVGTEEHTAKFNDYIKATSKKGVLNQSEDNTVDSFLFTDNEIQDLLAQGYVEHIGGSLLFKQPGMDGYHSNMADLRDFIEIWTSKLQSKINNRLIDMILKHFKPEVYGNSFTKSNDLSSKLFECQKTVESLLKLYFFILYRRVLEGKDKQEKLKTERLHMKDIEDIKMIERRCTQIESTVRFLKYMRWFVDNSTFFLDYPSLTKDILRNTEIKRNEKKEHYRTNLDQSIKNFVVSDSLFIDKILEESGIKGSSPKAIYGNILKSSKFSDIKMENAEDKPTEISYPLKDIEEFIILLKSTNIKKIQDYIILYTLLDSGYDMNEYQFERLLQELDLKEVLQEIRVYWKLDTDFIVEEGRREVQKAFAEVDLGRLQWHTEILQALIELKADEGVVGSFINWKEISERPRNSLELITYFLWEKGSYNQAFMSLLQVEDEINSVRYKNLFKLYVTQMLTNGKFDLLISQHLTNAQEELIKEILQADDSGLNQLYFFSFVAARGSKLEALNATKAFIDKLKYEKIDLGRVGSNEARFIYDVLSTLMRMHSHWLPAVQKKFAFDYLRLEKGKYQIVMNSKLAKDRIGQEQMDVEMSDSVEGTSENEKYTPFLSRKVDEILEAKVPKFYADPLNKSNNKNYDESKPSVIKLKRSEKKDLSVNKQSEQNRGGYMNRLATPFEYFKTNKSKQKNPLTIQKRDYMIDDLDDQIVYQEQEEDIQAGKQTVSKFLNSLKSKPKPTSSIPNYPNIASPDLRSLSKSKQNQLNSKPKESSEQAPEPIQSISRESLKAEFIEASKRFNIPVRADKVEEDKEEVYAKPQKYEVELEEIEPESLMKKPDEEMIYEEEEESEKDVMQPLNIDFGGRQRRMSFEYSKPKGFGMISDVDMLEDDILGDPNTCMAANFQRPNFSNANDDIEAMRRKRQAHNKKIMNFLYAGEMPKKNKVKRELGDIHVGSDYTPEKDIEINRRGFERPPIDRIEEDKEESVCEINEMQVNQSPPQNVAQSEQVFDRENPLNARISNRSIKETVRSDMAGVNYEDRQTEGLAILDKVKRLVAQNPRPFGQQDNFDVVREIVSDSHSEQSISQSAEASSDNSVAAPSIDGKEVVVQAQSSESEKPEEEEEDVIETRNRRIARNKQTPKKSTGRGSSKKYKGKKQYKKTSKTRKNNKS